MLELHTFKLDSLKSRYDSAREGKLSVVRPVG